MNSQNNTHMFPIGTTMATENADEVGTLIGGGEEFAILRLPNGDVVARAWDECEPAVPMVGNIDSGTDEIANRVFWQAQSLNSLERAADKGGEEVKAAFAVLQKSTAELCEQVWPQEAATA